MNQILNEDRPLSNFEIDKYYEVQPHYKGVHYIFEPLPPLLPQDFMIICIDRDPHDETLGHFVLLYRLNGTTMIYFNSYSVITPLSILRFSERQGCKDIVTNELIYQNTSSACGFFTVFVADHLIVGEPFTKIMERFKENNEPFNLVMLKKYFND